MTEKINNKRQGNYYQGWKPQGSSTFIPAYFKEFIRAKNSDEEINTQKSEGMDQ